MDEKKINLEQAGEELEIVELDERLDMAFDPLSMVLSLKGATNGNCNNTQCCGKAF
jgi:hypothetical protein